MQLVLVYHWNVYLVHWVHLQLSGADGMYLTSSLIKILSGLRKDGEDKTGDLSFKAVFANQPLEFHAV